MKWPSKLTKKDRLSICLNQLLECCQASQPLPSRGMRMQQTPRGTFNQPIAGSARNAQVEMYRLKSVQNDYVTCRSWDGETEGETDVLIAKPYKIRESLTTETIFGVAHTFTYSTGPDSNNRYRTNTDGTSTETELIIPAWVVDEVVFAMEAEHTGVEVDEEELTLLLVGSWRQWAKV